MSGQNKNNRNEKVSFFVLFYDLSKLFTFILLLTHTVGPSIISLIAASICWLGFCSVPPPPPSSYIPQSIFIFSHSAHPVLPRHFSPSLMCDRQNPSSKTLPVLSLSSYPINSLRRSSFLINRILHDTLGCRAGSVLITTQCCVRMRKKEEYEDAYKDM